MQEPPNQLASGISSRQVPGLRSPCPAVGSFNDYHLADFQCLLNGSKVETNTSEHFGELGVRKSCDIPDCDFILQDLASVVSYFEWLWFGNFCPALGGKVFQMGLNEFILFPTRFVRKLYPQSSS